MTEYLTGGGGGGGGGGGVGGGRGLDTNLLLTLECEAIITVGHSDLYCCVSICTFHISRELLTSMCWFNAN